MTDYLKNEAKIGCLVYKFESVISAIYKQMFHSWQGLRIAKDH